MQNFLQGNIFVKGAPHLFFTQKKLIRFKAKFKILVKFARMILIMTVDWLRYIQQNIRINIEFKFSVPMNFASTFNK